MSLRWFRVQELELVACDLRTCLCIANNVHTVQEAVDPAIFAFMDIIIMITITIIVNWPSQAGPESLK